ncbi:MAG: hypothetical protein HYT80_11455, partial [Euryarchaeota archaeon]|nr:hypothetical protein [Euryarchaeota archaeon]
MLGRTLTLLAGFLVLSGCFSFGAKNGLDVKDPVVAPLDPATVRAEGATIEAAGAGVRVTWAGQVQGEATHKVTIPPQALIM